MKFKVNKQALEYESNVNPEEIPEEIEFDTVQELLEFIDKLGIHVMIGRNYDDNEWEIDHPYSL